MMIRENTRARELIDEAGAMSFSPKSDEQLKAAIAELRTSGGTENDTEARAVALALLAESDPAYQSRTLMPKLSWQTEVAGALRFLRSMR
jgi:hypothetical protein